MLAGVLMSLVAAFGLSGLMGGSDDTDDGDDSDHVEPDEPDMAEAQAQEFIAGGVPGTTVVQDFQPGRDVLHLRVPGDTEAMDLTEGADGTGASIAYVSADDVIEIRFEGLETVPVDDIGVLIDGDGDPIPLSDFLSAAETVETDVLPPDDPDTPSEPGDPGEGGVAPGDPDAPSTPGDPDGPDDDVILPTDPSLPAGTGGSSDLAALMQRDGADPTGQTDRPDSIAATGKGDDRVTLEDDGADGGEGSVRLSEAAAVTGGQVFDLGAGDDTLAAGDGAVAVFGGAGDDVLAAGDGGGALYGGDGADVLTGDAGAGGTDLLHGGSGDDLIVGGDGGDYLDGGEHAEAPAEGDDTIRGGGSDDTIRGGWGADSLAGGDGDDVIDHRGTDETRIVQEEWHHAWTSDGAVDTLDGGDGNDTLTFASGDIATGGAGEDLFWVYPEATGAAPALITDFAPGEDFLRITLNTGLDGDVSVVPSEDGADGLVLVGGEVVAVLEGAPDATTLDIYVEVRPEVFP